MHHILVSHVRLILTCWVILLDISTTPISLKADFLTLYTLCHNLCTSSYILSSIIFAPTFVKKPGIDDNKYVKAQTGEKQRMYVRHECKTLTYYWCCCYCYSDLLYQLVFTVSWSSDKLIKNNCLFFSPKKESLSFF